LLRRRLSLRVGAAAAVAETDVNEAHGDGTDDGKAAHDTADDGSDI
jgi:hypothetical protein